MTSLPGGRTWICQLDQAELSEATQAALTRLLAFLVVVRQPDVQTKAMLAGYTESIHRDGVYCAAWLAGQRSFGEWRAWRALRPRTDPDLPELVAELDAWYQRWQQRAIDAVQAVQDPDERAELEILLGSAEGETNGSLTQRAKRWARLVEQLDRTPVDGYRATWQALVEQGIEPELERFHDVLETVQDFIRTAPLDAAELQEMHEARESFAGHARQWLSDRRAQFESEVDEDTMVLLALRQRLPPPLPDVPLHHLADFSAAAKA